jgi:hypothetical protein
MSSIHQLVPFTAILADIHRTSRSELRYGWCGMAPTFTNRKALRLWTKFSATGTDEDELRFFEHPYMQGMAKRATKTMQKKYRAALRRGEPWCLFDTVERAEDVDQWGIERQNLHFRSSGEDRAFTVRLGLDPETWEFSIKPVPLVWLYDARFVRFLQELVFDVPGELGLLPSIAHGGCQFSLSAATYMTGSLLCDDIADKFNHPELSTWIFDYPNCDDRCFRATKERRAAYQRIIDQYWSGAFHPGATGRLTVENAILDRGFYPAAMPPPGLMARPGGPIGSDAEIFQTNFAFGRAVRHYAQNIHPGYWQGAHPDSLGYRPDQIMRYSEGNLNRLRIHGELHVKSDTVLDGKQVPEFHAPLALEQLYHEASWENRAQYGRTSARDFVEAILHDVHRAEYLRRHPGVQPRPSLLQDQLLGEAAETLVHHGAAARLEELRLASRKSNLEESGGRIKSDFIEPEQLFWAAWQALPRREQAAIGREVINQFVRRVEEAAECDPRRTGEVRDGYDPGEGVAEGSSPMVWHRHRFHPLLTAALLAEKSVLTAAEPAQRELVALQAEPERYLTRRPPWSSGKSSPPWEPSQPERDPSSVETSNGRS